MNRKMNPTELSKRLAGIYPERGRLMLVLILMLDTNANANADTYADADANVHANIVVDDNELNMNRKTDTGGFMINLENKDIGGNNQSDSDIYRHREKLKMRYNTKKQSFKSGTLSSKIYPFKYAYPRAGDTRNSNSISSIIVLFLR